MWAAKRGAMLNRVKPKFKRLLKDYITMCMVLHSMGVNSPFPPNKSPKLWSTGANNWSLHLSASLDL